jgi:hypothetical protein
MLNGTADTMCPIDMARKQAELARQLVPTLRMIEIEGGDHFFVLGKRAETFGAIRDFIDGTGSR